MGVQHDVLMRQRNRFVAHLVMTDHVDLDVVITFLKETRRNRDFIMQLPVAIFNDPTGKALPLYLHHNPITRSGILPAHYASNKGVML